MFSAHPESLPQNSFFHGAGLFRDPLTGNIAGGGQNLDTLKTEPLKREAGHQFGGTAGNPPAGGARSDPVSKIHKVMIAIDEVQPHSAQEASGLSVEDAKAVFCVSLPGFGAGK